MKKLLKFLFLFFVITLFNISCNKEDDNNSSITEEVKKVETDYQEGDVKIETFFKAGDIKVETSASDEYKDSIRLALERNVSKKTTYLKSGSNTVGVIASGSCGQYSRFDVCMDNEDDGNSSSASGWRGNCQFDGNVILKFCMVYNAYFTHIIGKDFAVLDISTRSLPTGVSEIIRFFDNEDDNNWNWLQIDGVTQPKGQQYGQSYFSSNTRLGFYYYPSSDAVSAGNFPSLGISYGVFGRFGNNQGWIHTDDEDDSNSNWCILNRYLKSTGEYQKGSSGNIPNIMNVGGNTTLYMSKVY